MSEENHDHITLENMDNLNEDELRYYLLTTDRILEQKFKNEQLPPHRRWMLLPYNIIILGMTMYYTINIQKISKKFFKPKTRGVGEIIKYGTIQSVMFLSIYLGGTAVVSGFYHPVEYLRTLAKIKGKQIDNAVKFDPLAQEYILFSMMNYFGLSPDVLAKAKLELDQQKRVLEDRNFFSEDTLKLLNQPMQKVTKDDDDEIV